MGMPLDIYKGYMLTHDTCLRNYNGGDYCEDYP